MATPTRQIEPQWAEEQTLEIIRDLLVELGSHQAARHVSLSSSFDRDLGLGSLERVELLVRCEAKFDIQLPDEIAQQAETPAEWVRAILDGNVPTAVQPRYRIVLPRREAPAAPESATTLLEVLRRHAEIEPDRVHIHLPEDDSGRDITYGKLLETASAVATGLVEQGLRRDETVAIMLPTGADFFFAFLGVLMAGGIPVPIYPPTRPDKIEEYVRRQILILRNAEIRFLITFDRVKTVSQLMRPKLPSLVGVVTVESLRKAGAGLPAVSVTPAEAALIQYTSGSTGEPKGVVLSHANILANVRGIGWAVKVRPTDVVVSWLPLYHDMGLIGSWLFSLYYATPITVLSPLAFLGKPERWLWALHDAKATLCPAPNFAYELCARKIPDRALEGLDLSNWRVAINAGEAVLPETLARFAQRFAKYGFRPESFLPCYGLAESTVALTFPPIDRLPLVDTIRRQPFEASGRTEPAVPSSPSGLAVTAGGAGAPESRQKAHGTPESGSPGRAPAWMLPEDPDVIRFVSAGAPMPGHEVRIVDEQDRDLGERQQGRVLFRGLSRTPGYFRNSEATAAVTTGDGWMDSGDLGYWAAGELFLTGRHKDCIIKSGRNIIPQEVEVAASRVAGVRQGCVAAFGVVDPASGTERLVVVAETRAAGQEELRRIRTEIVRSVGTVLGIPPDKVVLAPPQTIPKTSSGKIRRSETRSLYRAGKLQAAKRPPWLQFTRLWTENLASWLRLGLRRTADRLQKIYSGSLLWLTCGTAGLWARLMPARSRPSALNGSLEASSRCVRWAARRFLHLGGYEVTVEGADQIRTRGPAILVANNPDRLSPLVLAATLPVPFVLADAGVLGPLPPAAAFLLKPLVIPPLEEEVVPRGGTLRQRIRQALDGGTWVLVLPEGPVGQPAARSRFRLDAFHAAVETSSPVHPIALLSLPPGLERAGVAAKGAGLDVAGRLATRKKAKVVIGEEIRAESTVHREMVRLRDRVREVLRTATSEE